MKLWINPFLNTLYEWGLDKYWNDKLSFIRYLDDAGDHRTGKMEGDIEDYIKEKVPEWYWRDGFAWWIGTGFYDEIYNAWESGEPFKIGSSDEHKDEEERRRRRRVGRRMYRRGDYEGYPEYLKNTEGLVMEVYPHQQGSGSPEDGYPYVKLINVSGGWFNSLYFTSVKGESWCGISSKPIFINWINRNPMEVKE
jgi:hypothetical protein